MDVLGRALPYVLPLALAIITAIVSPALVTPRRLRHDLSIDASLVDQLPTHERIDLQQDIKRRARHLIAMTRYPTVTLYDLLALLGLTTIAAVYYTDIIRALRDNEPPLLGDPLASGVLVIFTGGCWGAFYVPWASRARARLLHIRDHLGRQEALESSRTVRVAWFAAISMGLIAVVGLQLAIAVAGFKTLGTEAWVAWVNAAFGAVMGSFLMLLCTRRAGGLLGLLHELTDDYQASVAAMIEQRARRDAKRRKAPDGASSSRRGLHRPPRR